jgi:hypothetical protein
MPFIIEKESDETAVITLANGDKIRLYEGDDGLGVMGYSLKVVADKLVTVRPRSDNAVIISTPTAVKAADAEVERVWKERKSTKGE